MAEDRMPPGIALRRLSAVEATARGDRLRSIFRDAVHAASPTIFDEGQKAVWSATADEVGRWGPWLADGATWIAETADPATHPAACGRPDAARAEVVAFAIRHPADHLHQLYVDPAFQRRGLGRALLVAATDEAGADGVPSLSADANPISHPVFAATGWDLVGWENFVHRGKVFPRAKMRKVLW